MANQRAPKVPTPGPVPADLKLTSLDITADALSDWIAKNPSADVGGVRISQDTKSVAVYWKGSPPAGLRSLADTQAVPVTFHASPYSLAELDPIARQVLADNRDLVSSTGPSKDYSGISVTLWSTAPLEATMAQLNTKATVPIIFDRVADPVDLTGATTDTSTNRAQTGCVEPARCADYPNFYGGGLIRVRGLTPIWSRTCSTGVALYAGIHQYMTTAAHCGESGTWVSYGNGEVLGAVNSNLDHYKPAADIMIIEAPNTFRVWNGDWNTQVSQPVIGMRRPADEQYVAVSGGVSGNNNAQQVESSNRYWSTSAASTVGPGFFVNPYVTDRIWGYVTPGDSGGPVIRSDSGGNFEIQGFLSKGQNDVSTPANCAPGRNPDFPPVTNPPTKCYGDFWAVYADVAINSYVGVHLKTVTDPG